MRRLVSSSVLLLLLVVATPALASPVRSTSYSTALFSLRIDRTSSANHVSLVGTGQIDNAQRISSLAFTERGRKMQAVISSIPILTVFVKDSRSTAWSELMLDEIGLLIDPAVPLRLDPRSGRVLGTENLAGVPTTKYALMVRLPEAAMLGGSYPVASVPVTAWIDGSGAVRRMLAVITAKSNNVVVSKTVIDERLSGFGAAIQIRRPPSTMSPPLRANLAESVLDRALVDIAAYGADHRGYVGMTPVAIRNTIDTVFPDVTIVRATATTYCVQATVNGTTAHQNGPKAAYAAGPC
jgi:hypothetical protein